MVCLQDGPWYALLEKVFLSMPLLFFCCDSGLTGSKDKVATEMEIEPGPLMIGSVRQPYALETYDIALSVTPY